MYPSVNKEALIKINYLDITISLSENNTMTEYKISEEVYSFLIECNGTQNHQEIIEKLSKKYNVESQEIERDFSSIFSCLIKNKLLYVDRSPREAQINILGDFNKIVPNSLSIAITNQCQLLCQHCFNNSGTANNKTNLEISAILDAIDCVSLLGTNAIFLTGGEPTLHPKFDSILEYCVSKMNHTTIATNGYYFNNNWFDIIRGKNVIIQVSIDGNKDFHDMFRGIEDSYNNAYSTIQKAIENNIEVHISYTLTNDNLHHIELEVLKAKQYGVSTFNIGLVMATGRAKENFLELSKDNVLCEKIVQLYRQYTTAFFRVGFEITDENREILEGEISLKNKCGAGYRQLHINHNGIVNPCPSLDSIVLGDLCQTDLSTILSGNRIKAMPEMLTPCLKYCKGCIHENICHGCLNKCILLNYKKCGVIK